MDRDSAYRLSKAGRVATRTDECKRMLTFLPSLRLPADDPFVARNEARWSRSDRGLGVSRRGGGAGICDRLLVAVVRGPTDYRVALEAFNGTPGYARDLLGLAERYRSLGGEPIPPAQRPLELPADGPVIAAFGQRLGILHDGVDIDAPAGAPVRAAAAGLVVSTCSHPIFGEYACVLHRFPGAPPRARELTTCYGNQSGYEAAPGDVVSAGELIGRVGYTGTCVRPHVHFRSDSAPARRRRSPTRPFLAGEARPTRQGEPLETPAS